jgi:hypothetical protein
VIVRSRYFGCVHQIMPDEVTAPRLRWRLIKVLFRGDHDDPGNHEPEGYSVAVGLWDGDPCLAVRWNANPDRPLGNPHSRGLPTWFIVPPGLDRAVLSTLPADAQTYVRTIMPTLGESQK